MGEDDLAPAIRATARADAFREAAAMVEAEAKEEARDLCYMTANRLYAVAAALRQKGEE